MTTNQSNSPSIASNLTPEDVYKLAFKSFRIAAYDPIVRGGYRVGVLGEVAVRFKNGVPHLYGRGGVAGYGVPDFARGGVDRRVSLDSPIRSALTIIELEKFLESFAERNPDIDTSVAVNKLRERAMKVMQLADSSFEFQGADLLMVSAWARKIQRNNNTFDTTFRTRKVPAGKGSVAFISRNGVPLVTMWDGNYVVDGGCIAEGRYHALGDEALVEWERVINLDVTGVTVNVAA